MKNGREIFELCERQIEKTSKCRPTRSHPLAAARARGDFKFIFHVLGTTAVGRLPFVFYVRAVNVVSERERDRRVDKAFFSQPRLSDSDVSGGRTRVVRARTSTTSGGGGAPTGRSRSRARAGERSSVLALASLFARLVDTL